MTSAGKFPWLRLRRLTLTLLLLRSLLVEVPGLQLEEHARGQPLRLRVRQLHELRLRLLVEIGAGALPPLAAGHIRKKSEPALAEGEC